jgi:DNA-binding response OmpR family regulator
MNTGGGEDYERNKGLDIVADDYFVKPFSPAEVMARIRAVMRRIGRADTHGRQVFSQSNLTSSGRVLRHGRRRADPC